MAGCCRMSSESVFWLVGMLVFDITAALLVGLGLPWYTEDAVKSLYTPEDITESTSHTFTIFPATDKSSEEINLEDSAFLQHFRTITELSEAILREQHVKDWKSTVSSIQTTYNTYYKLYNTYGSKKDKRDEYSKLLSFCELNRGPYDVMNGFEAFMAPKHKTSFPTTPVEGHNLYSYSLTSQDWAKLMNNSNEEIKLKEDCEKSMEVQTEDVNTPECKEYKDYMKEKTAWASHYTIIDSVSKAVYGTNRLAFSYDTKYKSGLNSIYKELNAMGKEWFPSGNLKKYYQAVVQLYKAPTTSSDDGQDHEEEPTGTRFTKNVKTATKAWCNVLDAKLDFLLGPYGNSFDDMTGLKRTWCAYAGLVDSNLTTYARKYADYVGGKEYSTKPKLAPNVLCMDVLLEQEGRVGPPKTLSFTVPPVEDIMGDDEYYAGTDLTPKSYVMVNEIKAMYNRVFKALAKRMGIRERTYHEGALVQLFVSIETARLEGFGLNSDSGSDTPASERYTTTAETHAINFVKAIVASMGDVKEAGLNSDETLMPCSNTGTLDGQSVPYCTHFVQAVIEMGVVELVYLLQFGANTPYARYATFALQSLTSTDALTLSVVDGTCTAGFNIDGSAIEYLVEAARTVVANLARAEMSGAAPDPLAGGVAVPSQCSALLTEGYWTVSL